MNLITSLLITFVTHIVAHADPALITTSEVDKECLTEWKLIEPLYVNRYYRENLRRGSNTTQKILIGEW